MSLLLQDPADPGAPYLLECLLTACDTAVHGGGAFAWATAQGAEVLLGDKTFQKFLGRGSFDLVIGIDAVTNPSALAKLSSLSASVPSLKVDVFLHSRPKALFHPKACWFVGPDGGTIIAGSGNLTLGGLRGNWEAFSILHVTKAEIEKIEAQWLAWRTRHQSLFRNPSAPEVVAEAAKNTGWKSRSRGPDGEHGTSAATEDASANEASEVTADSPVLIAEIPKAGNRWNQANFSLSIYEGYFGAKAGTQRRIILRHVSDAGQLVTLESRPSVEVASQNYRFELAAAAGIPYPAKGRPVAVFVRQPSGIFVYRLVLPADPGYAPVNTLLGAKWKGRNREMRRITTTASELQKYWPQSPILNPSEPGE